MENVKDKMNPATPNIPVHGDGSRIDDLFETNNSAVCVCVCACGRIQRTAHVVDYLFGVN